ncbi:MAG: pyridoxal phosphate-dependent aminotransferase family protein [Bacteroidales bacterium]|jgi:8-amino-7-oxononanoate synthase|nr:pyridoxal phosphate-dependent aminotransferase family protein [Bacteroidales bacterium]MBR4177165.1 pyridoxal phosphate-dependent aminotransferase family protein [Bacteroidales bacterium]MBR4715107.1 pyridoxal phosphate-dependent aminotransferase family protein [Bacteroidales bacterium]
MKPLQQKLSRYTTPQEVKAKGVYPYFREISSDQDTMVTMEGKRILMLGSNSYLGLTNHPKIKEAAKAAIDKYGTGCAGSPFLNGTLDIHHKLEGILADFLGKDGVMLFSAGFQANSGVIPCITGRNDYVIFDEMDHASIIEGKRLTFANTLKYRHNDMKDLERVLQRCPLDAAKLVVTDGVFSMEGDVAKLPEMQVLCDKYQATLMVDEAHGLGVFGREGRGVTDHFNLLDKTELIMGTFSKSLASIGGFIAADKDTINWMRHNVRPYIFTASIPPSATASVIAAIEIMRSEPERQENLWKVANYALKSFRDAGFEIGNTETPIIPLYVRDNEKTFMVTKMLLDEGVFVNPVISPAVPPEDTLIRLAWMATHTIEQVDFAVEKTVKCFKKLGLL